MFFTIQDKIEYSRLSFDEKILFLINTDNFENKIIVDEIVFMKEVFVSDDENGYFCVATSSSEETINFCYIRDKNGKLEFAGKSIADLNAIIENKDPAAFGQTSILNFSKIDFYFGCYCHADNLKIAVDGEEVSTDSFSVNYSGETYNMDFWLVCSENEPTVTVK